MRVEATRGQPLRVEATRGQPLRVVEATRGQPLRVVETTRGQPLRVVEAKRGQPLRVEATRGQPLRVVEATREVEVENSFYRHSAVASGRQPSYGETSSAYTQRGWRPSRASGGGFKTESSFRQRFGPQAGPPTRPE